MFLLKKPFLKSIIYHDAGHHPNQKAETMKLRDDLQKALDDNDMEAVKAKLDALEKAAQMAAQQMYQQQDASNNANYGSNQDDNVVDADFTEKN